MANSETTLQDLMAAAQQWLAPGGVAVVLGLVWRASARNTALAKTQGEHADKLAEHHKAIEGLRASDSDRKAAIAGLPTREDMRELREEIRSRAAETQTQMQIGFENITRIMRRD